MRFFILFLVFSSIIIVAGCRDIATTEVVSDEYSAAKLMPSKQSLVKSSNDFGLKLFRELNKYQKNQNIFISPLSLSLALGMVLKGAKTQTKTEIKITLLFNDLSQDQIDSY
jgi:serine protease inhibitor